MKSKILALWAMILMVVVIIILICTRVISSIWEYTAAFTAFMAIFCHLMAIMLYRMSASASKKLDLIAIVFGILTIVAIIVIFILNMIAFS